MKTLLALALGFMAFNAEISHASTFKSTNNLTNPNAQRVYKAVNKIDFYFKDAFVITKRTAANGRTELQRREAAIKEAMHKYACHFFDEEINIVKNSNTNDGVESLLRDLSLDDRFSDNESTVKALRAALESAVSDNFIELWSGSASGNNTAGDVAALYDTENEEIIIFGNTNCGSDD